MLLLRSTDQVKVTLRPRIELEQRDDAHMNEEEGEDVSFIVAAILSFRHYG